MVQCHRIQPVPESFPVGEKAGYRVRENIRGGLSERDAEKQRRYAFGDGANVMPGCGSVFDIAERSGQTDVFTGPVTLEDHRPSCSINKAWTFGIQPVSIFSTSSERARGSSPASVGLATSQPSARMAGAVSISWAAVVSGRLQARRPVRMMRRVNIGCLVNQTAIYSLDQTLTMAVDRPLAHVLESLCWLWPACSVAGSICEAITSDGRPLVKQVLTPSIYHQLIAARLHRLANLIDDIAGEANDAFCRRAGFGVCRRRSTLR